MKNARQILGEKIKVFRELVGLSIVHLAAKMGTKRTFIYDVEAGRKNFTVDYWEKLLHACGISAERALAGFTTADIEPESQDLHRMLKIIVKSGDPDLIHAIRVNLDTIADKALRLHKARASPLPPSRVGEDRMEGTATGRRKKVKQTS